MNLLSLNAEDEIKSDLAASASNINLDSNGSVDIDPNPSIVQHSNRNISPSPLTGFERFESEKSTETLFGFLRCENVVKEMKSVECGNTCQKNRTKKKNATKNEHKPSNRSNKTKIQLHFSKTVMRKAKQFKFVVHHRNKKANEVDKRIMTRLQRRLLFTNKITPSQTIQRPSTPIYSSSSINMEYFMEMLGLKPAAI